jgi:hypothetical protein
MTTNIINDKTKIKPWTEQHKTRFIWLFNYLKTINPNLNISDYIDKNKRLLSGLIENNKDWSDSSKEGLYFMISRYLFNKNNSDRYVKIYSKLGFNLMKIKEDKEGKNELDDKEIINYRPYKYFLEVFENTPDNDNIIKHYQKLLLGMLIFNPPLRTSFYSSCKLLNKHADNNKKDNYIYFNNRGKIHTYFIINKDKATNYKLYNINKEFNKIEIKNDLLNNYLYNSFEKYPRQFLFEVNKKKVNNETLLKWLRDITKIEKINFSIMRAIYVTWFYENNKTYGARDDLSHKMRHSQATASKNYLKIIDKTETEEEQQGKPEINFKCVQEIEELKNKLSVYEKNKDDIKAFNKKRYDTIYISNKKGTAPKESTILKYNIKIKDGIYY